LLAAAHDEEHTLNLDHPECNTGGLLVVQGNDKPLFDMRDCKMTKAVLHEDGGGIPITEPSVASFLVKEVE
jgi:hypothetical protein